MEEYNGRTQCYPYEGGINDGIEYQDSRDEPPHMENSKLVAAVKEG